MTLIIKVPPAALALDRKEVNAAIKQIGKEVADIARKELNRGSGSGKNYTITGKKHQASAPGQPPVTLSGELAKSLQVRTRGDRVTVIAQGRGDGFYATALEKGAKGSAGQHKNGSKWDRKNWTLEPRPFLEPAVDAVAPSAGEAVTKALLDGLSLKT